LTQEYILNSSLGSRMSSRIAIIGSGPTGIYTFRSLVNCNRPLSITIFEIEADPGKGTPYHPHINDRAMLANITSVELPAICETLVEWLRRQPDTELQRLNVERAEIREREFYPRVVLGEFLQSQFRQLVETGVTNGHTIEVKPRHRVVDIMLQTDEIRLTVRMPEGERRDYAFDHVVMATGHNWPENTEIKPGYFLSPWPAPALKEIGPGSVGIVGTSLSAIDALITVATARGAFYLDVGGQLQYQVASTSGKFHASLMSRKGLLPEADFYCPYPYTPLQFCTVDAVQALIQRGSTGLLDEVFDLFKREIVFCDPDYAAKIGLPLLSVETLAPAYFADREAADPFVWAASNLAEAEQNKIKGHTVEWRYAILRMHEVIALAVPHLDEEDLIRFHKHFKTVFVDDYATVPHQSIQRLLALRRAGRLEILRLGDQYEISTDGVERGAIVRHNGTEAAFDAFIDATGQASLSARDLPFPSLIEQGVMRRASTTEGSPILGLDNDEVSARTGVIDLDAAFRPRFEENFCHQLYCAAISFLLHKMPFVQGITSSHEIGGIVSKAIIDYIDANESGTLLKSGQAPVDAV
jgi:uncharacterized NAD(P)/FAD-binding protein YdhS